MTGSLPFLAARRSATRFCGLCGFRFGRSHESAHEFAVGLRCERVHIQSFFGEKLARIFHAVNAGWRNLHLLETCRLELVAIFAFLQRSRHTAYPEKYVLADLCIDFPAGDDVGDGQPSARL